MIAEIGPWRVELRGQAVDLYIRRGRALEWCGRGRWQCGRIVDCGVVLDRDPERAGALWAELDRALREAIAREAMAQ